MTQHADAKTKEIASDLVRAMLKDGEVVSTGTEEVLRTALACAWQLGRTEAWEEIEAEISSKVEHSRPKD